tara:strand:- start:197 stop:457 length:261 start_codon:yes stop_codon:yes gene_type:complete
MLPDVSLTILKKIMSADELIHEKENAYYSYSAETSFTSYIKNNNNKNSNDDNDNENDNNKSSNNQDVSVLRTSIDDLSEQILISLR